MSFRYSNLLLRLVGCPEDMVLICLVYEPAPNDRDYATSYENVRLAVGERAIQNRSCNDGRQSGAAHGRQAPSSERSDAVPCTVPVCETPII
jgi:hypothetical protein